MLSRTIGSVLRGRTTPGQIMLATLLGALLGFGPGLSQGPAFVVAIVLLLVILPANIGLATVSYALSSLLALLLAPVSFWVGRGLLDGPTQGLFRALVNAPVLALCGFEYYAVTGGLVIGAVLAIVASRLLIRSLRGIRQRLAGLEAGSERYQKIASTGPARLAQWLFLGSKDAGTGWAELEVPARGRWVRRSGLVVAAVLVAVGFAANTALTGPLLTRALKSSLEVVNGATVDLESAKLDLAAGRFEAHGLQFADANDLDRNVFSAGQLVADVSGADLLRKRLRLDSVVISEAHQGGARQSPGHRVGRAPEPPSAGEILTTEKQIEEYVKTAKLWKERLSQVRRWLEGLNGDDSSEKAVKDGVETMRERLKRQVEDEGWRHVAASHLIEGSPTFAVTQLDAEGVECDSLPGEVLDIHAANLSTQPSLLPGAPTLSVHSRSGNVLVDLGLGGLASQPAASKVDVAVKGIDVDRIAGDLDVGGKPPIAGGTLDFSLQGGWSGGRVGWLDLPLQIVLHDTTLSLGGKSQKVSHFALPLGIRGPIDDPRISIDDDHLLASLKDAGAAALQDKLKEEEQKAIDKATEKLGDKAKDALGGLLNKKKKP